MRINSAVMGLIASVALFAGFAVAQQNDPGMQQSDMSTMKQQGADMTKDTQTVKQVQQALSDKGYYQGRADGKWSSKTKSALKQFQQAQGMTATGQLDQQTLASLGVSGGAAAGGQQNMPSQHGGAAGGQHGSMQGQQSGQAGGGQQSGSSY